MKYIKVLALNTLLLTGSVLAQPWDQAQSTANDALNTANAARSLSEQVNSKVDQTQANLDDMARCNGEYGNMAVCQGSGDSVDTSNLVTNETFKEHADAEAIKNAAQDTAINENKKNIELQYELSMDNADRLDNTDDTIANLKGSIGEMNETLQGTTDTANTAFEKSYANEEAISKETDDRIDGDQQTLNSAKDYANNGDAQTLSQAKSYTDQGNVQTLKSANTYTDTVADKTLNESKSYTDKTVQQAKDETKVYIDTSISDEATERKAGDAQTLTAAEVYADVGDKTTLLSANGYAQSYTDQKLGSYAEQQATIDYRQDIAIAGLNNRVGQLENRMDKVEHDVTALKGMIAANVAANSIQLPRNWNGNLAVGLGVGHYDGYNGLAVGLVHDHGNWATKVTVGGTDADNWSNLAVGASANWCF